MVGSSDTVSAVCIVEYITDVIYGTGAGTGDPYHTAIGEPEVSENINIIG